MSIDTQVSERHLAGFQKKQKTFFIKKNIYNLFNFLLSDMDFLFHDNISVGRKFNKLQMLLFYKK